MLHLLFIDWTKAFDKIYHDKIFQSLRRYGTPESLIDQVKKLYNNPTFCVSANSNTSEFKSQETGIRQRCPLSPFLFVLTTSALIQDTLMHDHLNLIVHRPINATFSERLYADDTIIISTSAAALTRYLKELEMAAATYGLTPNQKKTAHMAFRDNRHVLFVDGTVVKKTTCKSILVFLSISPSTLIWS